MTNALGTRYDRLVFNRRLLTWLHFVSASAVAFSYLSTLDLHHFAYWRLNAGLIAVERTLLPMLPYLISVIHSRRHAAADRFGTLLFALILVLTTIAACYWYFGPGKEVGAFGVLLLIVVQLLVFSWATRAFLGEVSREH